MAAFFRLYLQHLVPCQTPGTGQGVETQEL